MKSLRISDLHFKHNRLPSLHLATSLGIMFQENYDLLVDLDAIFIAGDLTHTSISIHDPDTLIMLKWLNDLVKFCHTHNIALRALEGTASHDLRQATILYGIPLIEEIDFKYIDKPYVETLFDETVLYVPDDWTSSRDQLDQDIAEVLKENGLQQVDTAILHGLFDYQLPNSQQHVAFNEEYMLSIVKGYISIGHVHVFNPKGRILPQGSFDRMSFNEEEDKGGIYIDSEVEGYQRLINHNALIFKDIDVNGLEHSDQIKDVITSCPENSWFRLVGPKSNPLIASIGDVRSEFKQYNIMTKPDKKSDDGKSDINLLEMTPKLTLNENTLSQAFKEYLTTKQYSAEDITSSTQCLLSVMKGELT